MVAGWAVAQTAYVKLDSFCDGEIYRVEGDGRLVVGIIWLRAVCLSVACGMLATGTTCAPSLREGPRVPFAEGLVRPPCAFQATWPRPHVALCPLGPTHPPTEAAFCLRSSLMSHAP